MSPVSCCTTLPSRTRSLIGLEKAISSVWNATSIPIVIEPSMTRKPPTPRTTAVETIASTIGSTARNPFDTPSRCSAVLDFAW